MTLAETLLYINEAENGDGDFDNDVEDLNYAPNSRYF